MELLTNAFVVLHLLGLAAIVGSVVVVSRGIPTPALVWGARAQIITGLILVAWAKPATTRSTTPRSA